MSAPSCDIKEALALGTGGYASCGLGPQLSFIAAREGPC